MIESGTSVAGVDARDWGLPSATALRIELPAPDLRGFFTNYHVLDSDAQVHAGAVSYPLPSWPMIRIALTRGPISVRLGPRCYDPLPAAALYGTTTRAMQTTTHGGVTVGIGITPLGWSRLFTISAAAVRDQVVSLSTLLPAPAVDALVEQLRAADLTTDFAAILDSFLRAHLLPPTPHEDVIRGLEALIADEQTEDIASASEHLGLTPAALRRLSIRFFGYPPKLLLVRARFMRSLLRMMLADGADYSNIAPTYFDKSHFLRDARRFLDTTPRRFLQRNNPYVRAIMRARRDVARAAARMAEHG
ncbi:AraC family transcriptional regulator [Sphingomonas sp. HHU CXW]|uniref:AraC family transcriptional regulator n=1 Tax=Sphingomonas hominis TaxID=2741495 RepID=A0ABX2JF31_9SPHN|nr:helix-turn-helix domain-containing protein [Sphingomonas hominis]NTS64234.1 AraC family transcriptional regulator [Sphingomonas hominis]